MAKSVIKVHGGRPFIEIFDQWAKGDGQQRIEKVLAAAQAAAPVDTGAYKESLHIERVDHPTRPVLRVVAGTDHGMIVESRTGNLARALDAASS